VLTRECEPRQTNVECNGKEQEYSEGVKLTMAMHSVMSGEVKGIKSLISECGVRQLNAI
jgi:hypothetical protein